VKQFRDSQNVPTAVRLISGHVEQETEKDNFTVKGVEDIMGGQQMFFKKKPGQEPIIKLNDKVVKELDDNNEAIKYCPFCKKNLIKDSKYIYKPDCKCFPSRWRIIIG